MRSSPLDQIYWNGTELNAVMLRVVVAKLVYTAFFALLAAVDRVVVGERRGADVTKEWIVSLGTRASQ